MWNADKGVRRLCHGQIGGRCAACNMAARQTAWETGGYGKEFRLHILFQNSSPFSHLLFEIENLLEFFLAACR